MGEEGKKIGKQFDLEERTLDFARAVIKFVKGLPQHIANREIIKQLIRSACSVGANYIEAKECLGRKDFTMRAKICRKEAKESRYWLMLVEILNEKQVIQRKLLMQEADELRRIFSAIILKTRIYFFGIWNFEIGI